MVKKGENMKKTLFEANAESKEVKALGVELDIDLSKIKILINGNDIAEFIKIKDLKIIEE